METDKDFQAAYKEIEFRMKSRAELDGDVFLPNIEPIEPVDYVFISMEPSLGRWASSADEAKAKIEGGFRNFVSSIEDFIVDFCIRQYLCLPTERYHITDISKGAMLVRDAGSSRTERYDRWLGLLMEELDLVAKVDAGVVAFGNIVAEYLQQRSFPRPLTKVIHFSTLAGKARNDGIIGREHDFLNFKNSVTLKQVLEGAEDVLITTDLTTAARKNRLNKLAKQDLSDSQRRLIFNYKIAFESLRLARQVGVGGVY